MWAVFVTVLSLISMSCSAPLDCEQLVRPLAQLDPLASVGRWALIAGSLKNPAAESALRKQDSIAIEINNSSYIQAIFQDDKCQYDTLDVTVEGNVLKLKGSYNFTLTFHHTSCSDCALFLLDVQAFNNTTSDFYLLSKRRQLEKTELEEFRTQVECLKMPPPVVMDPAKVLCPEQDTNLVRPLNQLDLHRLEGTWAMVAGSLTPALPQSASVKFFSNTSDSNISYTLSIRLHGKCRYTSFNITLEGSSFTFDGTDKSNLSASFVQTSCPDCMLMSTSYNSGQRRHLYLLSKRRQVEEAEVEEFRAQAKCLNLSPPGVMDPTEDLCPEQKTINMIWAVCAVTLVCLVSVGHSSSLACEELVRPLDQLDPRHLEGTWALVAGSLSQLPFLERFKQRDSASVKFFSNTSDSNISYTRSLRLEGKCRHSSYNITLEGSGFTFDGTDKSNLSANFVHTSCRDCMLMRLNVDSGVRLHFYLFSKRRQLEETEMEEFRTQVKCMNMPPPVVMDPTKDLCPEQKTSNIILAMSTVVLLCLTSPGHSAPLACEDLIRPSNQLDLHHLEGRRAMVAGSLSHLPYFEGLRLRHSATAQFSAISNGTGIRFSRSRRLDNKCHYASYNISLESSSFTFDNGSVNTTFIHTSCRDCILLSFDVESGKRQHFYLFSSRRKLEQEEIEEFKAQVECFNLPPPVVMDPTKDICPEQASTPLSCENLIQPLDQLQFDSLKGGWSLVSASVADPAQLESLKQRDSARVLFANHSDSSMTLTRVYASDDNCQYTRSNITLEGSGFSISQFNVTVTVLRTSCPDCTVMRFNDKADKPVRLYLFSKRREVEPQVMEEFKALAECLKMSAPVDMDPTKKLCPEEIRSTPLGCEKLVLPLESMVSHHLNGRWALVAGSLSNAPAMKALGQRDSITMYFSNSSDVSTFSYTQINRFGDECQHLAYNISVENSTFTFDGGNRFNLSGAFLQTSCSDCLVMKWIVRSKRRHSVELYLLSRRREIESREMKEFRDQLECHQLPEPVVMDSTKEHCEARTEE
ncbi:unnamed protein product, partial [Menidia menidia]